MPLRCHIRIGRPGLETMAGGEFDVNEETPNILMIFMAGFLWGISVAVVIVVVFG